MKTEELLQAVRAAPPSVRLAFAALRSTESGADWKSRGAFVMLATIFALRDLGVI